MAVYDTGKSQSSTYVIEDDLWRNVQVCHPFLQELHRSIGRFGLLRSLLHLVHINCPVEDDIWMGER